MCIQSLTAQQLANYTPTLGQIIFNSTTQRLQQWSGSGWVYFDMTTTPPSPDPIPSPVTGDVTLYLAATKNGEQTFTTPDTITNWNLNYMSTASSFNSQNGIIRFYVAGLYYLNTQVTVERTVTTGINEQVTLDLIRTDSAGNDATVIGSTYGVLFDSIKTSLNLNLTFNASVSNRYLLRINTSSGISSRVTPSTYLEIFYVS
jgi:hypothetical protein